ncbi:MAG TPA: hypothetical protein DD490_21465 [Acidobacteria bacterium]|nr:hypothetical protein [Acidobacteriota bacterium]
MKRMSHSWFPLFAAAALVVSSLPAHAGVSIDRASASIGACAWGPAASDVFRAPAIPAQGCDISVVGPQIDIFDASYGMGINDDVDALATNEALLPNINYSILFSADLASQGLGGTVYNAEFLAGQAAGDILRTVSLTTASPRTVMGFPCGGAATIPFGPPNMFRNQELFNLIPSTGPGIPYGGVEDEVDGFELDPLDTSIPADFIHNRAIYFSIDPASVFAASPAAVLRVPIGGAAPVVWATPANLGLVPADDIDALVVWDLGAPGAVVPGLDMVLFSLAPGSPSLGPNSAADLFVSDMTGAFCLYLQANMLGLRAADNLDALDVMP